MFLIHCKGPALKLQPLAYDAISGKYLGELDYGTNYSVQASSEDGVGFFYGGASGSVLGDVEHMLVRDSWETPVN